MINNRRCQTSSCSLPLALAGWTPRYWGMKASSLVSHHTCHSVLWCLKNMQVLKTSINSTKLHKLMNEDTNSSFYNAVSIENTGTDHISFSYLFVSARSQLFSAGWWTCPSCVDGLDPAAWCIAPWWAHWTGLFSSFLICCGTPWSTRQMKTIRNQWNHSWKQLWLTFIYPVQPLDVFQTNSQDCGEALSCRQKNWGGLISYASCWARIRFLISEGSFNVKKPGK